VKSVQPAGHPVSDSTESIVSGWSGRNWSVVAVSMGHPGDARRSDP